MPNWCSNNLTFRHADRAKLEAAHKAFMERRFCEHFVPLPNGEWDYDFCVNNWGTKWEIDGESSLDSDQVSCSFDSAWSPPIDVYKAMCAQGFEVEASYYEPGMCFVGKVVGNQEDFDDDCYEYGGETSHTVRDVIGADLDDEWGISENMAQWEDEQAEQDLDSLREDYKFPPHTD